MLVRLILSLVLAAFTLPAMATAPCHDTPAPMAMAAHHSMPVRENPAHQDKAIVAHDCIGCIPPSSLKSGMEIASSPKRAEIRIAGFARLNPGTAPTPATPPPRAKA